MDYSNYGILNMLQDVQRQLWGKTSVFINIYQDTDMEKYLSACIFDKDNRAKCFNFHNDESEEEHKDTYIRFYDIVKQFV